MRYVALAVMLVAVVLLAGCGKTADDDRGGILPRATERTDAVSKPAAKPTPDATPIEVTAEVLFRAYKDNVAAADLKYLDKKVRVKGRVLGIESTATGYTVGIETGPNIMPDGRVLKTAVTAFCSSSERATVAKMGDFTHVVIEGVCRGQQTASGRTGGILITIADAKILSAVK